MYYYENIKNGDININIYILLYKHKHGMEYWEKDHELVCTME